MKNTTALISKNPNREDKVESLQELNWYISLLIISGAILFVSYLLQGSWRYDDLHPSIGYHVPKIKVINELHDLDKHRNTRSPMYHPCLIADKFVYHNAYVHCAHDREFNSCGFGINGLIGASHLKPKTNKRFLNIVTNDTEDLELNSIKVKDSCVDSHRVKKEDLNIVKHDNHIYLSGNTGNSIYLRQYFV